MTWYDHFHGLDKETKFLLMTMDYGSKFPDAIPLQKVDTPTVATGLVDIFTRYGLLEEILTDQGSVFVRLLMKDLCSTMGIN